MTAVAYYINDILIPANVNPVVNLQWENTTISTAEILITGTFDNDILLVAFDGSEIVVKLLHDENTIQITGTVYDVINRTGSSRIAIDDIVIVTDGVIGPIVHGTGEAVANNFVVFSDETGTEIIDSGYSHSDFATIDTIVTNGNNHDHVGGDGAQLDHAYLSNVGSNSHTQIDSHITDYDNPHATTIENLDDVDTTGKTDQFVLTWDADSSKWIPQEAPGAEAGEVNTASNIGSEGVGLYDSKSDVDLQFKNINSGSTKITVTDNETDDTVDIDVDAAKVIEYTHSASSKTTPVNGDEIPIIDSEDSNTLKKLTWTNQKATLKTYFDGLYAATSHNQAASTITSGTLDSARIPDLSSTYATAAKGVTNGDSHDHNGGDGGQVDHTKLSNIGSNTHSTIDTFISSKAAVSGLASLDSSSKVVQDPVNATVTPTINKIPIASETGGKLALGWLPDLTGTYAVAAKGVTNGDSHDHNGGDGAELSQYAALAGRVGGQTLYGGTASGNGLNLTSTSNATKGKIYFGSGMFYDDVNGRLGIGVASPTTSLNLADGNIISFADNGEIRSMDANHKIVFDRSHNVLDLIEYGAVILSPGAVTGVRNSKVFCDTNGISILKGSAPSYALDVAGDVYASGYFRGDGSMLTGVAGSQYVVSVGPYSWCNYITDGTADDVQIQAAIDYLVATYGAGTVQLVIANYFPSSTIFVKKHITLRGANIPYNGGYAYNFNDKQASRFHITYNGGAAFIMYAGAAIERAAFYYPNQVTNATPTWYPATIALAMDGSIAPEDCTIKECLGVNPYVWVDANVSHERLRFLWNVGEPILYGVFISTCMDIDYLIGNHFNPNYGNSMGETLLTWIRNNAIAFTTYQDDGGKIQQNHAWGYRMGVLCYSTDGLEISQNDFDRCSYPIYSDGGHNLRIINNSMNAFGDTSSSPSGATGITLHRGSGNDGTANIVIGNKITSAGTAIYVNTSNSVINDNNIIYFNSSTVGAKGIQFDSYADQSVANNNNISGNGYANSMGMAAEAGCDGFSFIGNKIYNCPAWGIYIVNGSNYYVVSQNNCRSCGSGNSYGNGANILASGSINLVA